MMNESLFTGQEGRGLKGWQRTLILIISLVAVIAINNSYDISIKKKNYKIQKLKGELSRSKEKRAYQKSMLARLKANDKILKVIKENQLDLEYAKEAPILLIDQLNKED